MEKPDISPATEEERGWAAQLLAGTDPWITLHITLEQCLKTCQDKEHLLFVAHLNDRPCGVIVLQRRGVAGSPYIKSVAVAHESRRQGIGAALVGYAENLFRREAKHIFLCVSSFNNSALTFYERNGYNAVGEFKDYIIEGASEILMHKRIQ